MTSACLNVMHKDVHTQGWCCVFKGSVSAREVDFEQLQGFYFDGFLFNSLVSLQCYKFVLGADERNWQDARSYCVNQGGNLVSILNYREQGKPHFTYVVAASQ